MMIAGIAVLLLAAVTGFDFMLDGVAGVPQTVEAPAVAPSLSVASRSNVRAGDSTEYPIVGKLEVGEEVAILGISQGSAGWYYIELPDNARGFISPDVVTTQGDLTNLAVIDPASLAASATPPPATAESTQPAATPAATEQPDEAQPDEAQPGEAQPATPTASG